MAATERLAAVGLYDKTFPFLFDGGGTTTSCTVINLEKRAVGVEAYFINSSGGSWEIDIRDIGRTPGLLAVLAPGESLPFETVGNGEGISEGYIAVFTVDRPGERNAVTTSDRVGGTCLASVQIASGPKTEIVTNMSPNFEPSFVLSFDNRKGFNTAVKLINSASRETSISASLRDSRGRVLRTENLSLRAGQAVSGILTDLFPQSADSLGLVVVTATGVGLTGYGLRISPEGAFAPISTMAVDDPSAPPRPTITPGALPGATGCAAIENGLVFADDGQFLGKVTTDRFSSDSIANEFSRYGSSFSSTSMFNQFGTYGSEFSSLSPNNPFANRPPVIFIRDRPAIYVTANSARTPRLTFQTLAGCVGRR